MAVARWLETDSNTNKDISTAVSIGAYTADADRLLVVDVSVDAVAGNGDYVVYLTRQINGSGSAYVLLPKTTCAAASGETAIAMQSGMISVKSGDVVTCYIDGLAGDTTTPDTAVRWYEMATLRPTVAGRTLVLTEDGSVTEVRSVVTMGPASISSASIATGALTAAKFGTDAITANAVSEAAVTKLQAGIPAAVWANATRTLSSFGTLVADIWAYVTRSLTDKLGFGLSSAYDGVTISVQSLVTAEGDATIDQGYDYYAADGRELSWEDDESTWPDLTGATVELVVAGEEFACSVTTPSGPATVTLELSAEDTNTLGVGLHPFVIRATLANTHTVSLLTGYFTVRG